MEIGLGEGISVDAQVMLTGRCCVIGQSGSGKSYLVGVIAEELSKNKLPYIIIDTEGEYNSLKSAFDILWVGGEGADLPIDIDYDKLLRKSIENNVPIVFDLSDEIEKSERVESLLSTLYSIEEKTRTPYLVIIEEADKFSPQILHKGLSGIEEISVRGRKRGIGLIVATQRPANINKNVLAQCSYGFVGKLTIENDIKAVNILFDDKSNLTKLPALKTGEFISFGLGENERFRVKERSVKHVGATPQLKIGERRNVNIDALIKELKGGTRVRVAKTPTKQAGPGELVIKERVGDDFAKAFASRKLRKRFLVFGENVEELENIGEKYLPVFVAMLRVPTRRKNEFEERYLVLNKDMKALIISGGISVTDRIVSRVIKISGTERKVLMSVNGRRMSEIEDIARSNGISEGEVFKAMDRLEDTGLISVDGDRIRVTDKEHFLISERPEFLSRIISDVDVIGKGASRKEIEASIALAFPSAEVLEVKQAYLPLYEITLRIGDRVRIFRIDALFGKELGSEIS